jgi:uncharacterized protein (TIGR02611 family)
MVRIAKIGAGMGLILLGLFLLVLPGPGILTIAGGLAILATEFTWARNLLDWMKDRYRSYFPPTEPIEAEIESAPEDDRDASIGEPTT